MKCKVVFLLMILFITNNSYSQTKKETENWIAYYLNRYLGNLQFGKELYTTQHFYFNNQKLIVNISSYNRINNRSDSLFESKTKTVDIKKLLKVYLCSQSDSTRSDKFFVANLCFDFKEKILDDDENVIEYNIIKKETTSLYYTRLTMTTLNSDILKDSIPQRIEKAFQHLVTLYGGEPIKEAF